MERIRCGKFRSERDAGLILPGVRSHSGGSKSFLKTAWHVSCIHKRGTQIGASSQNQPGGAGQQPKGPALLCPSGRSERAPKNYYFRLVKCCSLALTGRSEAFSGLRPGSFFWDWRCCFGCRRVAQPLRHHRPAPRRIGRTWITFPRVFRPRFFETGKPCPMKAWQRHLERTRQRSARPAKRSD